MKLRLGFVSNSSSASYTITINKDIRTFLKTVMIECWYPYLTTTHLHNILVYQIDKYTSIIEQRKNNESIAWNSTIYELKLKTYKTYLEFISKFKKEPLFDQTVSEEDKLMLVSIALELSNVQVKEESDKTIITKETSMHNNFSENLSDFIKEIVLVYSFIFPEDISLRMNSTY